MILVYAAPSFPPIIAFHAPGLLDPDAEVSWRGSTHRITGGDSLRGHHRGNGPRHIGVARHHQQATQTIDGAMNVCDYADDARRSM